MTVLKDERQLKFMVGPKLVKSIDNFFQLNKKDRNLPLIWQHIKYPLANSSSVIRAEAIHEYIDRQYKIYKLKHQNQKMFDPERPQMNQFNIDFPPLGVDYIAQFMECEKHHFQFITERNFDGTRKIRHESSLTKSVRPPSNDTMKR